MNEKKLDIPSKCWNKFKELHTDKIVYINKIYEIFNDLSTILNEFDNKYKSLEIEKFINPIINNKINETIKMINKSIISFINLNQTMVKNILKCFKDINKLLKDENKNYDQTILCSMEYEEEKQKINQSKKLIYDKFKLLEESIKSEIIDKTEIKVDKKEIETAINEFKNYKIYVNEANKKRINFNKTQNELLKCYQKVIIEKESEFYQKININFFQVQKTENDSTSGYMEKIKDKKKINKKEYNKEIFDLYLSKEKPEEEIEVCCYNIQQRPYPTNNDSKPEDILNISQLSEEIIKRMRKYLTDNFPDTNLQIQEAALDLPGILNDFFEIELELTDEAKNTIIKLIKDDIKIYPQILILLSRIRANSKLYKSKPHIEFLGYILKEILEIAEEKKDYNAAKNCILLSQTYYIKDEKTNEKLYAFDKIRNNKWTNSAEFWRVFINNQILIQFKRFESLYPGQILNLEENNTNLPKKYLGRVREIYFSCLLSHISNMMEFFIDKRIVLKILDEFLNKYQYLDEGSKNNLYAIVTTDKEEILQLRKEYQENSNLDNKLIDNKESIKVEDKKE